jgi:hypothetical protein
MRLSSSLGTYCLLLAISGVVAIACGSDDDKKPERDYSSAGDGGADASGGGSSSVEAGSGGSLNQAGDSTVPGGEAGTGAVEPMGGTANTGAGGDGGAGNVTPFHGLYIREEGDDTADGTREAPFETLAHAASVAQAGDTIVFLDGAYTLSTTVSHSGRRQLDG